MDDYYKLMGLSIDSTAEEIKSRYRVLMLRLHPDKNNSQMAEDKELFFKIQRGYPILSNIETRKNYDNQLLASDPHAHDKIDIDHQAFDDDDDVEIECEQCRSNFSIFKTELDQGYNVFECDSCSHKIEVNFDGKDSSTPQE
mmetsp:Transcript_42501/g.48839  ORF Transcript_42501/g.48839 Transcript_42501/m.48839 type:complete len:142 (+) Transcript_42501:36-461(+)